MSLLDYSNPEHGPIMVQHFVSCHIKQLPCYHIQSLQHPLEDLRYCRNMIDYNIDIGTIFRLAHLYIYNSIEQFRSLQSLVHFLSLCNLKGIYHWQIALPDLLQIAHSIYQ